MIETPEDIGGKRLTPGETFRFACRPGLDCFNSCCRDKRLPLWPYDLLRLRRGLGLNSLEILETHVELEFDPRSGWPALRLRLDDEGRCPLLTPQGCRAYRDRPAACRVYPLARASRERGGKMEVVYFRQATKNCLGWDQETTHDVASWTGDQGLAEYDRANDRMYKLFFHPKRKGRLELNPRQTHAVIAALYNIDVFRQMAARPDFPVQDREKVERALESDEELLILGRDFLIGQLFG